MLFRRRPDPATTAVDMALDLIAEVRSAKRLLELAQQSNTRASERVRDTVQRRGITGEVPAITSGTALSAPGANHAD